MTDSTASSGTAPTPEAGDEGQLPGVPGVGFTDAAGAGDPSTLAPPLDFTGTLKEYEPKLLRYAAALLGPGSGARLVEGATGLSRGGGGDGRDAQPGDLVQEAFLRLHRYCREHGSSAVAHPGTWLYRVVHNLAMDTIRQRIRRRGAQPKIEDAARRRAAAAAHADEAALGQLEQREMVALAMCLLGDLPEQQQQVITLKLLEGLTLRQIAEVLGSSPGSVNYHLNQGLARLAQQLRQRGAV